MTGRAASPVAARPIRRSRPGRAFLAALLLAGLAACARTVDLGRPERSAWLGYGAPLAGLAMALVAALVWRRGLLRYQGVGH